MVQMVSREIAARYGVTRPNGNVNGSPVYRIPELCHAPENGKHDLAIWDGEGGSIGVRCHSRGCSTQTIRDALGLEFTYENRRHSDATGRSVIRRRGPGKDLTGNTGSPKGLYVTLDANDTPDKSVVLVEGEKAADALASYQSPKFTAAYWVGGTGSVAGADYSPLKGRNVVLWPDHDAAGLTAMEKAGVCAQAAGAAMLRMIPMRALAAANVPHGGDAADLMGLEIAALLDAAEVFTPPPAVSDVSRTLGSGASFERHAEGWLAALAALGLEIRGNVRSQVAEVRHRAHGTPEALAFEKASGLDPNPTGWASFDTRAQEYVRHVWERGYRYDNGRPYRVSQELFQSWMNAMLAGRMVDPVRPWMEDLPEWDGKERLPTLFTDALGAADTELHRAAAIAFLVGGVKRTYEPGCQHDWAPVLIGGQGSGKSTFCRELMPEGHDGWYAVVSSLAQEVQKQVEQIASALVVEFKEMRGAGRYEAVKSYIDTGADTYRPPYARTSERHKRRWIGIGTGNDEGQGVLPDDPNGNRRYVAIPVSTPGESQEDRAAHVRQYMAVNRAQLWAEALHRYRRAERSYLGGQYEAMRDTQNADYTRSNQPMEEIALDLTRKHADTVEPISLAALMVESGIAKDVAEAQEKVKKSGRQLAGLLARLQWERKTVTVDGKQQRLWFPPKRTPPEPNRCELCAAPIIDDDVQPGIPREEVKVCRICIDATLARTPKGGDLAGGFVVYPGDVVDETLREWAKKRAIHLQAEEDNGRCGGASPCWCRESAVSPDQAPLDGMPTAPVHT